MMRVPVVTLTGLTAMLLVPTLIFAFTLLKAPEPRAVHFDFQASDTISLLALGDQGVGNLRQWQVARAMEASAAEQAVDAVLLLGDNFYRRGIESTDDWQWRYKFENVYRDSLFHTPFYATLGNHDYYGNQLDQIAYDLENHGSGRWQMPARDYVQLFGRAADQPLVRAVFIDTGFWLRNPLDATEKLDQLLTQTEAAHWTIVVTHTPLRSANEPDYWPEAPALWQPVLSTHGVDLLLSGHDHNFQFIDVPGWPPQVIAGVGGKSGQPLPDNDSTEGLQFHGFGPGFLRINVNSDGLNLLFLDIEGETLYETRLERNNLAVQSEAQVTN